MKSLLKDQEYEIALEEWKYSKEQERRFNIRRLVAEEAILKIVGSELKNSGTHHFEGGLKIITGLDNKWDNEALNIAHGEFINKGASFPFEINWKPDNKAIDVVKSASAELYEKYIMPALTVKPKKPSFSIKEQE